MDTPRQREHTRLMVYRDTFGTEAGQQVLADLKQKFLVNNINSKNHAAGNSSTGLAYIAGQRELILSIMNWLECDIEQRLQPYDHAQALDEKDPLHAGQSTERTTTFLP